MIKIKHFIQSGFYHISKLFIPELKLLRHYYLNNITSNLDAHSTVKLYPPYHLTNVAIGRYSYLSTNAKISMTTIGSFCSIGPNLLCGWGIHPTDGISTSPMFYSTKKQNGYTFSDTDLIEERKPISIGNDVFIGMNVTILDGVKIGDGAIIGAGAVVSKDIPPYAIAVGNPIKIIKYRFDEKTIEQLNELKWWDWTEDRLYLINKNFYTVKEFINTNN